MEIKGAKNIIAIISGKGGSGKSTITTLLARALQKKGLKVGILDADITGSSIPLLLGDIDEIMMCYDAKSDITPAMMGDIQVVSMALISTDESVPIIWNSDYSDEIMIQTVNDVMWDVDYLLVDLPPGSGSLNQTIIKEVDNIRYLFVAISQEIVRHDVLKSVSMVKHFGGNIIGMVENFADGKNEVIFKIVDETGVRLVGRIPTLPLSGDKIEYDKINNGFMDDIVKAVL
jgi:Mrp family chromosome partitioning ATPase